MKIQRTGPASLLLVLECGEACCPEDVKRCACRALAEAGIASDAAPELTAYTAGSETVVFVCAGAAQDTYFAFAQAEDLLDAAREAARLWPAADAALHRTAGQWMLGTAHPGAVLLLREYAAPVTHEPPDDAPPVRATFQELSGNSYGRT